MSSFTDRLLAGATAMNVPLNAAQAETMERYWQLVLQRNQHLNLTRITEEDAAVDGHFLDALTVLAKAQSAAWLQQGANVIDIGTGAGFPGIPLLIARPDLNFVLFDAREKRVEFVRESCEKLGLYAETVHARAEDVGHNPRFRANFDAVICRAVAETSLLLELSLPLLRAGGHALFYKGPSAEEEQTRAEKAVTALCGQFEGRFNTEVPGRDWRHVLLVYKQVRQAPPRFPRKPGQAGKLPF